MNDRFRRLWDAARRPFDERTDNCARAVAEAFADCRRAREAFAAHVYSANVLDAARKAAAAAGCAPAGPQGDAWGVCNSKDGRAICARIDGYWWRRGAVGVARVMTPDVIEAWET